MERQKPQRINNQQEFDELLKEKKKKDAFLECFIQLNFGFRSSKDIELNDSGDYYIFNEIDDSEEIIEHDKLMNSFLGEAIQKGALYKY